VVVHSNFNRVLVDMVELDRVGSLGFVILHVWRS